MKSRSPGSAPAGSDRRVRGAARLNSPARHRRSQVNPFTRTPQWSQEQPGMSLHQRGFCPRHPADDAVIIPGRMAAGNALQRRTLRARKGFSKVFEVDESVGTMSITEPPADFAPGSPNNQQLRFPVPPRPRSRPRNRNARPGKFDYEDENRGRGGWESASPFTAASPLFPRCRSSRLASRPRAKYKPPRPLCRATSLQKPQPARRSEQHFVRLINR